MIAFNGTRVRSSFLRSVMALIVGGMGFLPVFAQGEASRIPTGRLTVTKQQESLQMVATTSQYLALGRDIRTATVHNDAIIQVQSTARNEVLVSAVAAGVTQLDLKTTDDEVYNVQIVVIGDARELEATLRQEFPTASLRVRPIQNQGVIISGHVTADEHVEQVVQIAELYYSTVINKIEVIGVHTVMLQTQVMEVSRTKLRQLGIDWQMGFGNSFVGTTASGLISRGGTSPTLLNGANETFKFGVIDGSNSFFGLVRFLKQNDLAKVMADPTVVAIDGRPASFNSGGEFPILVPAGLGQVGVQFREFGTRLDFVAKVRGDGRIWLEVRPTISEIDPSRSVVLNGTSVPGIRSRFVDTAVELRAGQTLALAGLLQVRTESQTVGIPGLMDVPFLGAIFRSNKEVQNEVELLILVTPNFAGPMDAEEVPPGGPGFNSTSPTDRELYWKGYLEVPANCGPGGINTAPACPPSEPSTMLYNSAYGPSGPQGPAGQTAQRITPPNVPLSAQNPNARTQLAPITSGQPRR